jgi:hypothetical protein
MSHYAHREEAVVEINGSPEALFDYLDHHARLGAHMSKPSAMMMGGRMAYEFDERQGHAVGSVIRMHGSFLGLKLLAKEVVTERTRPARKVWETQGEQSLLIMTCYRMGFEIEPTEPGSSLRVFIEYDRPRSGLGQLLGFFFAPAYARWCVKRMATDAKVRFAETTNLAPGPTPAPASARM